MGIKDIEDLKPIGDPPQHQPPENVPKPTGPPPKPSDSRRSVRPAK